MSDKTKGEVARADLAAELNAKLTAKERECRGWIALVNRHKQTITDLEIELTNKMVEIEDLQAALAASKGESA